MRMLALILMALALAGPAWADWNVGDPYKMHYPQLPDPMGWDVNFKTPKVLADDWLCTESGPVSDVHLWLSSQGDQPFYLTNLHLSIHANIEGPPFSHPAMPALWEADFNPTQFTTRPYGTGPEGWYDPNTGQWFRPDHDQFYQLNIISIPNPFIQEQGKIYWLDVSVAAPDAHVGWKTSGSPHFMDDAVWGDLPVSGWQPLEDPITGQSLDLAFVITPEPATMSLLVLAGLALIWRRQRA